MNLILESVDNLGKGTFINRYIQRFGYHTILKYDKPIQTEYYLSLKDYQYDSFKQGLDIITSQNKIIMDRSYLGELIYADRYRGYSGDYVLDLEKQYSDRLGNVLLVLLCTDDFSFIVDDGLSLDVKQREAEQQDFILAFNQSVVPNKIGVNVHDGQGGFRSVDSIINEVISTYTHDDLNTLR